MWNRLISVVEEQALTLLRTAFSTSVREAGDLSAGVYNAKGEMLAQAVTGTPGHVNTMAAHLVRDPSRFDVIVATNFYSDILSDLASELSGSLGLAGSINANAETGLVCAQAQHGSAPDIQNKNIANPTSLILSAAMMLSWLGEQRGLPQFEAAGAEIERAVDEVLANPATRTRDLGGTTNTDAFGAAVAKAVRNRGGDRKAANA